MPRKLVQLNVKAEAAIKKTTILNTSYFLQYYLWNAIYEVFVHVSLKIYFFKFISGFLSFKYTNSLYTINLNLNSNPNPNPLCNRNNSAQ